MQVAPTATGARNYSQCDMLIGDKAGANTYPYAVREPSARWARGVHDKIGEDQLFYFQQRGIDTETTVGIIISGFATRCSTSSRWSSPRRWSSS